MTEENVKKVDLYDMKAREGDRFGMVIDRLAKISIDGTSSAKDKPIISELKEVPDLSGHTDTDK